MPTWPTTLSQCPIIGWTESPLSNVVEFDPDVGAPRRRRRSTLAGYEVGVQYRMTKADLATLWTFWETDLVDGVFEFDWPHPRYNGALRKAYVMEAPAVSQLTNNIYIVALAVRVF
jgi:hypothetical protein